MADARGVFVEPIADGYVNIEVLKNVEDCLGGLSLLQKVFSRE